MFTPDTIVALATPAAPAARAILRVSGERAFEFAQSLCRLRADYRFTSASAVAVDLEIAEGLIIPATLLSFSTPRSSTGENVVEFHLPGSPWIASTLLARLVAAGARQAEPGEFTSRAFLNGKLDLAAAEGVASTIAASNRSALAAARQLLAGELSRRLAPLSERLINALALVELEIDFSQEDVSFQSRTQLRVAIAQTRAALIALLTQAVTFERLDHEPRIVLAGRPNAGKSSLMNALAGRPRSVVTAIAGTTRDALSERVALPDGYVTFVDIAGIEDGANARDAIDVEMQQTALSEIEAADHVVMIHASDDKRPTLALTRQSDCFVRSKSDLSLFHNMSSAHRAPAIEVASAGTSTHSRVSDDDGLSDDGFRWIDASVVEPDGLSELRRSLNALAFPVAPIEAQGQVALNARHRQAVAAAIDSLTRADAATDAGAEFVAAELRSAVHELGLLLGTIAPDDVLARIFAGFCIGK